MNRSEAEKPNDNRAQRSLITWVKPSLSSRPLEGLLTCSPISHSTRTLEAFQAESTRPIRTRKPMRPSDSPTRTRRFRRPGSPLASPWCRQNFRCLLCRPSRSSRQGDRGGGRRDLGEAAAGYPIRRFLVRADAPVPSRRIPLPTITQVPKFHPIRPSLVWLVHVSPRSLWVPGLDVGYTERMDNCCLRVDRRTNSTLSGLL